jgi:hypothetical protein
MGIMLIYFFNDRCVFDVIIAILFVMKLYIIILSYIKLGGPKYSMDLRIGGFLSEWL